MKKSSHPTQAKTTPSHRSFAQDFWELNQILTEMEEKLARKPHQFSAKFEAPKMDEADFDSDDEMDQAPAPQIKPSSPR